MTIEVPDADENDPVEDLAVSFIDRMKANGSLASGLGGRELWHLVVSRAMCARKGVDPDQWYPVSAAPATVRREAAEAIALCTACVVRMHCLELSLRYWTVGQHGIWGGTVPAERAALRRELTERLSPPGPVVDITPRLRAVSGGDATAGLRPLGGP
jgi:hypothetical protein